MSALLLSTVTLTMNGLLSDIVGLAVLSGQVLGVFGQMAILSSDLE